MKFLIFAGILLLLFRVYMLYRNGKGEGTDFNNVTVEQASEMITSGKTQVIDVRTAREVSQGKIKKAQNIDVMDTSFAQKLVKLDKSKPYLVYCRSGQRSAKACRMMAKEGFEELYNLKGGYMSWQRSKK